MYFLPTLRTLTSACPRSSRPSGWSGLVRRGPETYEPPWDQIERKDMRRKHLRRRGSELVKKETPHATRLSGLSDRIRDPRLFRGSLGEDPSGPYARNWIGTTPAEGSVSLELRPGTPYSGPTLPPLPAGSVSPTGPIRVVLSPYRRNPGTVERNSLTETGRQCPHHQVREEDPQARDK